MTIQLDTIQLPSGLQWADEFESQSVAQSAKRALDGSLVVFYSGLQAGRSITLEGGSDHGWMTKAQVDAVKALADNPGGTYTLNIRGVNHQVMFRHHEAPAVEATPIFPYANPASGDYYVCRIKLMTV